MADTPEQQKIYGPPYDEVTMGVQKDGLRVWCAVANTQWGTIPGKGHTGRKSWYSYGGKEYETSDYGWIESPVPLERVKNTGSKPAKAFLAGKQNGEDYYAAITVTAEFGTVPGKAKDGRCWFPYVGKEHETTDFFWICKTS